MVTYFLEKKMITKLLFYVKLDKKNHMINISIHLNFHYIGKVNLCKNNYTLMFSLGFQISPVY